MAQPVLDVIGESPETVIFRQVDGPALVVFALVVALLPPVLLWTLEQAAALVGPGTRRAAHIVWVAGLLAVAGTVFAELTLGWDGVAALLVGLVAGVGSAAGLSRWNAPRLVLRYLAFLPIAAVILFLAASPAGDLLDPDRGVEVSSSGSTTPLVVLVLDELPTLSLLDRGGAIDAGRFPNFGRLSREATWFRNFSGASGFSDTAVPGLLTGRLPEPGASPTAATYPDSLFTLFGGSHRLRVGEALTQVCPESLCASGSSVLTGQRGGDRGLGPLLSDAAGVLGDLAWPWAEGDLDQAQFTEEVAVASLPPTAGGGEGPQTIGRPERFTAFLDGLVETPEPTFHLLHLVLPHSPWSFFSDGRQYAAPAEPPGLGLSAWGEDPAPRAIARHRHLLQTAYVDQLLGDFIHRLEGSGLWDQAVIVVTADHGISFGAGQRTRALSDANAHEVAWPPLFIRAPGLAPGMTDAHMEAMDLLPTLADLIGAEVPFPVDGDPAVRDGEPVGGEATRRFMRIHSEFLQPEPTGVVEIDGDEVLADLLAAARDPLTLEGLVPDLVGRATHELTIGPPAPATVRVEDLAELRDPGEGLLPALVRGTVSEAPGGSVVVFAVAGRVAGVSPVYATLDEARAVEALLDPDLLGEHNEVEAFLTDRRGEQLRPVEIEEG